MDPSPKVPAQSALPTISVETFAAKTINNFTLKGDSAERTITLDDGSSYTLTVAFGQTTDPQRRIDFLNTFDEGTISKMVEVANAMGLNTMKNADKDASPKQIKAVQFSLDANRSFNATKIFADNVPQKKTVSYAFYTESEKASEEKKKEKYAKMAKIFNELNAAYNKPAQTAKKIKTSDKQNKPIKKIAKKTTEKTEDKSVEKPAEKVIEKKPEAAKPAEKVIETPEKKSEPIIEKKSTDKNKNVS